MIIEFHHLPIYIFKKYFIVACADVYLHIF